MDQEDEPGTENVSNERSHTAQGSNNIDLADEEEEVPLWQKFIAENRKRLTKEKRLVEKTRMIRRKTEDPLKSMLFSAVKSFTKGKLQTFAKFLPDMEKEIFDKFLQRKKGLNEAQSRNFQLLKLMNWIMELTFYIMFGFLLLKDNKSKEYIMGIVCAVQLRVVCDKREKVDWLTVELQQPSEDNTQLKQSELIKFTRHWRSSLSDELDKNGDGTVVVQSKSLAPFALCAVINAQTTVRKRKLKTAPKENFSIYVAACDPRHPYLYFHGLAPGWTLSHDKIESFVDSLGLHYTKYKILRLRDMGLQSVYTSSLRSITVSDVHQLKQRLNDQEIVHDDLLDKNDDEMDVQPSKNVSNRNKRMLSSTIDEKNDGGFKNLTFKFISSTSDNNTSENDSRRSNSEDSVKYPVTVKFKSKRGKMDQAFLNLLEHDALEDPTMYLLAKAKKTNYLVLQQNRQ